MLIQTEYAAIYVMIHDTIACLEGLVQLKEEDFTSALTQDAFSIIKVLTEIGSPVDETIIKAKIKSDEFERQYNSFIRNVPCDIEKYQGYFDEIKDVSKKRKTIDILNQALLTAEKDNCDIHQLVRNTENKLLDIIIDPSKSSFSSLEDETKTIIKELKNPETIEQPAIVTGFRGFDNKVRINNGDLVLIAGRPSMGKSALALHFALNATIKHGHDVLFFSVEMPKRQIVTRMISSYTNIPLWKLLSGKGMTAEDWKKYEKYEPELLNGKRCFQINDDSSLNITEMMALCKREKMRNPNIKAIFVDYLQLMQESTDLVIETTVLSRSFKRLAKALNVPAIVLSQLSRKCEEREDKRPMLSDLRDSGCLSGDTKITCANGSHITIKELSDNFSPIEISTLEESNMKMGISTITNAFSTGVKELYEITLWSGRKIKATQNHKFYTINGWEKLSKLLIGDKIAVPRIYNRSTHYTPCNMDEAIFIAHIIADGSCMNTIRYSTASEENLEIVKNIANRLGAKINGGWSDQARSYQLHFGSYTKPNRILQLFKDLKLYKKRAHQKFIPDFIFMMEPHNIAIFLQHLWGCDGHFGIHKNDISIHYSTTSYDLALNVQELLVCLGVLSNIHTHKKIGYRDCYSVNIDGCENQRQFLGLLDDSGLKGDQIVKIKSRLTEIKENTNDDQYLSSLANSEIYWDRIRNIQDCGREEVYDLTISKTHNFIANNIITHNSLEQDADIVIFMYRPYIYERKEDIKNNCELIVGKQRNGETGIHYCGFDGNTQRFSEIP